MVDVTLVSVKGGPLTAVEFDANLTALRDAVNGLLAGGVVAQDVANIEATSDGSAINFTLSNGTVLGPIPLPAKPVNLKGEWVTGTAYLVGDIVTDAGNAYFVTTNHTAGSSLAADVTAHKLELLVAAGGPGYVDMGPWDSGTVYHRGEAVTDTYGIWWIASATTTAGQEPGVAGPWSRLTWPDPIPAANVSTSLGVSVEEFATGFAMTWRGAWSSTEGYRAGEVVKNGSGTDIWLSLRTIAPGGSAPSAGADWKQIA